MTAKLDRLKKTEEEGIKRLEAVRRIFKIYHISKQKTISKIWNKESNRPSEKLVKIRQRIHTNYLSLRVTQEYGCVT